jgi:hypothetical protein
MTNPTNTPLPRNLPFHPPQDCPPTAPCAQQPTRRAERKPYEPNQLSNAEAAVLKRATMAAQAELDSAKPRIDAAVAQLVEAEGRFRKQTHRLLAFAGSRRVAQVTAAQEHLRLRHEQDGPQDRRHRPRWARVLLWPTVLFAAVYDTAFFSSMLLRLIDEQASVRNVIFWVSLLPGVMITVALLAAGHWLAEALARSLAHRERRPTRITRRARLAGLLRRRPPRVDEREPQDLPWPQWALPILFAGTVLGIVAQWAWLRGRLSDSADMLPEAGAIAVLILLFSLSAIAIKMIHYNPFADDAAAKLWDVRRARHAYRWVLRKATAAADRYVAKGHHLASLLDVLESRTRQRIDQAWVGILDDRDRHGLATMIAPALVDAAGQTCRTSPEPCAHPTFNELGEPQVCLRLVMNARGVLGGHDLVGARTRLAEILEDLENQWSPEGGQSSSI